MRQTGLEKEMVSENSTCSVMVILDKTERTLVEDYVNTLDEVAKRHTRALLNACTSNTFSTGEQVTTWSSTRWSNTVKNLIDHISKHGNTSKYKIMVKDNINNRVVVSRGDFEESHVPERYIEAFIN